MTKYILRDYLKAVYLGDDATQVDLSWMRTETLTQLHKLLKTWGFYFDGEWRNTFTCADLLALYSKDLKITGSTLELYPLWVYRNPKEVDGGQDEVFCNLTIVEAIIQDRIEVP